MSAIESAFVTTVVDRETHDASARESISGTTTPTTTQYTNPIPACAQHDTTEKRIFGLRMWSSRSAERAKSEYGLPILVNK